MAVAATGFFDGVHRGHRSVIETLFKTASQRGEQSLIVTFWPHPRAVLRDGSRDLRLLSSLDEKMERLRESGVDRVEIIPFSTDFASFTAAEYLSLLSEKYSVTAIVLGHDNRFGSDGLSTAQIAQLAESVGITPVPVPALPGKEKGSVISSTLIRRTLASGDVKAASGMLGYEYAISGVVVGGNMMGRTIGFPTANLKLREPLKCIPGVGAYVSRVELDGREYRGMTNIDPDEKIETHILGFNEDIYGLDIKISFLEKIRDEIHFNSFEELKIQLEKDRLFSENFVSL